MQLTFIMRTKNRGYHLRHSLPSLAAQVNQDFRLIVLDYGGLDPAETVRIAKQSWEGASAPLEVWYVAQTPAVWRNAHAINTAARLVQTEYIGIVNPDDLFPPTLVDHVLGAVSPDCFVQCRRRNLPKSVSQEVYDGRDPALYEDYKDTLCQWESAAAEGELQVIPQVAYWKVGGYDESFMAWGYDDNDMSKRLQMLGLRRIWLDRKQCYLLHLHHGGRDKLLAAVNRAYFNSADSVVRNVGIEAGTGSSLERLL